MRKLALIAAALLAGFLGGFVGVRVYGPPPIHDTLRASRFELVDRAGKTTAFWGFDKTNNPVLAFGRRAPVTMPTGNILPGRTALGLDDPKDQLLAIGLQQDGTPSFTIRGSDGRDRVRLYLSNYENPMLLMGDKDRLQLSLGFDEYDAPSPTDDHWSLTFLHDWAAIGVERGPDKQRAGYLWLKDKRGSARIVR